jgi:NADPH2:quinone reductase
VGYRQWVLSFPGPMAVRLGCDAQRIRVPSAARDAAKHRRTTWPPVLGSDTGEPAMEALVCANNSPLRLAVQNVPEPAPLPNEALVAVRAVSLNRGELRNLETAAPGWRPGWDLAGDVLAAAADGSGPPVGARVVGLLRAGAWAERVAVPTHQLAVLPDAVSYADASTLPVAGLTALTALARRGSLIGQRVVITGAAGGVGWFAAQLAARGGADVTGVARSADRLIPLLERGAIQTAVTSLADAPGPFDLVLESTGGADLGVALTRLAPGGLIVNFGNSSRAPTTFNVSDLYGRGGASLYGLFLFDELVRRGNSGARDLGILGALVAAGELVPQISITAPWRAPWPALQALVDRALVGKAVLNFEAQVH